MIKLLYSAGCSWTHGNGIEQDPNFTSINLDDRKKFTWPAFLGQKLKFYTINDSIGAGSNARIVRKTVEFIEKINPTENNNILVIIGWTTPDRDEIYVPEYNNWLTYNPGQPFSEQFNGIPISDEQKEKNKIIDAIQKKYVTLLNNPRGELDKFFQQMYLLKNYLEYKKIRHIFFNALPWWWGPEELALEYYPKYESLKCDNFIGPGTNETFMQFCIDNNYPRSSCVHPMILGHRKWADRLYEKIEEIYPDIL